MNLDLSPGFLWGAATSAHQTEGNNTNSDWWAYEHAGAPYIREPSGDAVDSYHRWPEDMDLLAAAGFTDYRFGIEWARIEPAPGEFSAAQINHYREMVDGARSRGLRPFITLHHFTSPLWFEQDGGWTAPNSVEYFLRYLDAVTPIVEDGIDHVCTINEPNILALIPAVRTAGVSALTDAAVQPDTEVSANLIRAHHAARVRLKANHPHVQVGWSVAGLNLRAEPGARAVRDRYAFPRQTAFLEAARRDDWVGVQSYTRQRIGSDGEGAVLVPPPDGAKRTLTGWEYYPGAVGDAVRETARIVGSVPIIVTENGIATSDDQQRIAYTTESLESLRAAMSDGVDVRGYFHWSLLDNYEWGSFGPTFGLVAVDRRTFARTPKPSLHWLGSLRARTPLPSPVT